MRKSYLILWIINLLGWFFYSFTQIDLNLTLTRAPFLNGLFKSFQYIGYFQRPLSTYLFLFLLLFSFILYLLWLRESKKQGLSRKHFWQLIILSALLLLFSYPAFSYDLFNYMFDAKTIIVYHANPWVNKPLDFTGDPWLSFMHWTHRPSVYPPGWILLSLPFYVAGFNYFLAILFSFKILMTLGYLGSVYFLEKILSWQKNKEKYFHLAVFALNPAILLESLVSAHNDIVMMFFVILALWYLSQKKYLFSFGHLIFSALIKYLGLFLLPLFLWKLRVKKDLTIKDFRIGFLLMTIAFVFFISRIEIQPWYLVWLLPLLILADFRFLYPIFIALSIGLLLRYAPFLFLGNWNNPVPVYKLWLTVIPLVISILYIFITQKKTWLKK